MNRGAARFVKTVQLFVASEHSLDESVCAKARRSAMKTCLLLLGIVGCYVGLSLAASPLDASLCPAESGQLAGVVGGLVAKSAPVESDRFLSRPEPARSTLGQVRDRSRTRSSDRRSQRADERFDDIQPPVPIENSVEKNALDRFAPFFRESRPAPSSARTTDYLRDPFVIEKLVLL
jgi:hypothetical protein